MKMYSSIFEKVWANTHSDESILWRERQFQGYLHAYNKGQRSAAVDCAFFSRIMCKHLLLNQMKNHLCIHTECTHLLFPIEMGVFLKDHRKMSLISDGKVLVVQHVKPARLMSHVLSPRTLIHYLCPDSYKRSS